MRQRRFVPILLLAFVGMAALMLLQNRQQFNAPLPTPEFQLFRVFPDLEVLDIAAIQLVNPASAEQTFTMSRDTNGEWIEGNGAALQENAGSDLARTIVLLPYTQTFDLPPNEDLPQYGLSPQPLMLLQVLLADGTSHTVAIGQPSRTGQGHYALVDDDETMYFLLPEAVAFLITQLRDPPLA